MKINPIPGPAPMVDPQAPRPQDIRKLVMSTNASPDRFAQEGAIPDTNIDTNAGVEETKPLSPQFVQLAKQRRALQVKERELADREKALASQPALAGGDVMARIKSEPLSVLQEAGVTYDQLTEAILANQNGVTPEIQALRSELKALKEGVDTKFTDRDTQAEQQVLTEMRRDAAQLIREGDDFEMVRETRSLPDVMKLIERTYRESGEVLDVREALQLVEDDLVNESLKIANIKKVQSRLQPPAPLAPEPQSRFAPARQMRTLTNRDTARSIMSAKARAIAAFNGTLKK